MKKLILILILAAGSGCWRKAALGSCIDACNPEGYEFAIAEPQGSTGEEPLKVRCKCLKRECAKP